MPLIASRRSPFLIPTFSAGEPGITLSISAGTNGRANTGSLFSISRRLMSPGMAMSIFLLATTLPDASVTFLITCTVFASAMSR